MALPKSNVQGSQNQIVIISYHGLGAAETILSIKGAAKVKSALKAECSIAATREHARTWPEADCSTTICPSTLQNHDFLLWKHRPHFDVCCAMILKNKLNSTANDQRCRQSRRAHNGAQPKLSIMLQKSNG